MSHWTTIQTQIRDIDALHATCEEMGFVIEENAQARGFGANRQHGDYVIQLKGPYDIAVLRQSEGNFTLATDWWQGHVEQEVGRNYGRLLQLYAVNKATREAHKRGCRVRRKQLRNGTIKLSIGGV